MLTVKDLNIHIGDRPVVQDVNFTLKKGTCTGLVGESGSGKSLTALSLMGLLPKQARITGGQILFKDRNLAALSEKAFRDIRGKEISIVFQEPMTALNPVMHCGKQVVEMIRQHQKVSKDAARQKVLSLFEKVQIPRPEKIFSSYPHQISGGQKQRIMIAMALANHPDILIADEPTTALDVTVQKEILLLLKRLQQETGMSLLFISHDLNVVSGIADEILVMYQGKIVESGNRQQIFGNPQHAYTRALLACHPPLDKRLKKLATLDDFMRKENAEGFHPEEEKPEERKERLARLYTQKPLVRVEELVKSYPLQKSWRGKVIRSLQAVDHVSFQVYPGETLGLVGESGCGKTTLGRTLLRLIDPDSGRIFFEETDILPLSRKELKPYRKKTGIVFQDPYSSLNPRISIGKAIMEPMQVHKLYKGKELKQKTIELMIKTGLKPEHFHRYPHEFSGGQRQRIVIARALALNPRFIICDEAVSSLDISVQATVLNLLNRLKAEFGFTYIFISHDLSVVRFMSDRIIVMKEGKIVETGDADEIYYHPKHPYTQKLIAAIPVLQNTM
ncbi:ABC transporter ATP-binding protein [Candidatus Sulfidibacterium hydrothermale]|uniref:ABC transporter ATP-binding protein n=1 Tax=Candidatus Sulfidibacterium hydrothermale TaxID=2875962 RepID=UPI001F0B225E|nr:ABC transporter ATP-binding protein [Candidatus Sulfidibacterium hydrothermale]UBM62639.1 ABC transporter ATP-binding protein [Candidatus Sulfidibacterium hydrothermale]